MLPVIRGLTDAQLAALPKHVRDDGIVRAVLDRDAPLRVDDISRDARLNDVERRIVSIGPFLGVPVVADGHAIGAIPLGRLATDPPYDDRDELFVGAIARQTAVALDKASLLADREQEIGERRRAEMLLRVLQVVAAASNEATTVESALQACLDEVCTQTGWDVGHAWIARPGSTDELVSSGVWRVDDAGAERFERVRAVSATTTYHRGTGMIGLVFASGQPIWLSPITADPRFPRSTEVVDAGLRTVYIFPVSVGDRVAAVLEFFSVDDAPLDSSAKYSSQV